MFCRAGEGKHRRCSSREEEMENLRTGSSGEGICVINSPGQCRVRSHPGKGWEEGGRDTDKALDQK